MKRWRTEIPRDLHTQRVDQVRRCKWFYLDFSHLLFKENLPYLFYNIFMGRNLLRAYGMGKGCILRHVLRGPLLILGTN